MRALITLSLVLIALAAEAKEVFSSGPGKVSVIELYTSEGCSSCPPADAWLSKLKRQDELFKTVVPLAFHVDYWDYLGWRDEFSDASFSQRQRLYYQLGHTASVYTPGFVINGAEWRGFFSLSRNKPPIETQATPGILELVGEHQTYTATFTPAENKNTNLVINLAYLGTGLSNRIKRGENAGKELNHDFVVLAMHTLPMKKTDGNFQAELPRAEITHATAVAAWVSERDNPTPIQAVGGYLAVHQAGQ